jgi:hypothetical protein
MEKPNKNLFSTIALILMLTATTTIVFLPAANAHSPPWTLDTWAYIDVTPNPVGVNQPLAISMWVDKPMPGAVVGNDVRRHDYKLTITAPDGTTKTMEWPVISDTTSVQSTLFIPDKVGTYSFVFNYPAQKYTWDTTTEMKLWTNDTYKAATSRTVLVTVQQEKVTEPPTFPLPTEFWTRPIEEQNTAWNSLASNWLGTVSPRLVDTFQKDGAAPNTPHVMWTKSIQDGGVVGGSNLGPDGNTFYQGEAYNVRFSNPIIMNGRLYYDLPLGNARATGEVKCVDLITGEEIWYKDYKAWTTNGFRGYAFSFGYYYSYDHYNQHGVIPDGWLFTDNFGMAVSPRTGAIGFNVTNVPSGYEIVGPSGEHLRYQWSLQNGWLAQWNSSNVFIMQTSGVLNASTTNRYDWNVTIPKSIPLDATTRYAILNDMLLFSNIATTYGGRYGTNDPYTVGAISLKPSSRGQLLWMQNYSTPSVQVNTVGISRTWATADPVNRVFIMRDKETMVWQAYSIDDGRSLWTSNKIANAPDYEYFSTGGATAYGRLYYAGYGGILYCYDTKTGNLLFTYGNGGSGNSTNSGIQTPWGLYPLSIRAFADGKVYLATVEHSPNTPIYKNALIRCVDAYTGKEVWTMMGYGAKNVAVADGFLTYLNLYDEQIYCVGKGPSATTVDAPLTAVTKGQSLMLRGTVTDQSAGAKRLVEESKHSSIAAVSDSSMSAWMEYLYMQKPKPADTIGVTVKLTAYDPNGNSQNIGTTTTDANGKYGITWTPALEGTYYVIAEFEGTTAYWSSQDTTYFAVGTATALQPTSSPTPTQTVAPTVVPTATVSPSPVPNTGLSLGSEVYLGVAAVIVIVAVAATALVVRRRK